MSERDVFLGNDYLRSMREHYPELLSEEGLQTIDKQLHIGILKWWTLFSHLVGVDSPDRFEEFRNRAFSMKRNVWKSIAFEESPDGFRRFAASSCYKGLINLTPPTDLVLYSNLIWELRPRTIIEFGAMQGGSSLWFADQLEA